MAAYLIVVCTANICRSPMAAALLRHAFAAQPEPLRSLEVVSAGVAAHAGEAVTPNSVAALKKVGVEIPAHQSRPLTQELLDGALAVFCMTESHRAIIRANADPVPKRLLLFRELMPPGQRTEIRDPYGEALPAYEASRDEMVEAIPSIVSYLKTLL